MTVWGHNEVLAAFRSQSKRSRLPKEAELREYLDQFNISNAYSHIGLPSWTSRITKHLDRTPDDPDYEGCAGIYPLDIANYWVGNTFVNNKVKPQLIVREDIRTIQWPDWFDVSKPFKDAFTRSENDYRSTSCRTITRCSQMHPNSVERAFAAYRVEQLNRLVQELREKKFIAQRSEPELHDEIETRKKQYPGQRIYCMLGSQLVEYHRAIHGQPQWHGAVLIRPGSGYRGIGGFGKYQSAVFAHAQVRTAQEFLFTYALNRQPRRWEYKWISVMKFSLEVDERKEEYEQQIKIVPPSLSRFTAE